LRVSGPIVVALSPSLVPPDGVLLQLGSVEPSHRNVAVDPQARSLSLWLVRFWQGWFQASGFLGLLVTASPAQPLASVGAVATARRLGSSNSLSLARLGFRGVELSISLQPPPLPSPLLIVGRHRHRLSLSCGSRKKWLGFRAWTREMEQRRGWDFGCRGDAEKG